MFRDFCIDTSQGVFVGEHVLAWLMAGIAPGVHQWNVQIKNFVSFTHVCPCGGLLLSSELIPAQYLWSFTITYGICIFFIKLSILLQYLQIFVPLKSRNALYWTLHALIWTNLVFYLITFCLVLFSCKPIAKAWNPLITNGHCIDTLWAIISLTAAGAINSLSDIVILVLPQVSIWRLQMALRRKIQISAVFFIGLLLVWLS